MFVRFPDLLAIRVSFASTQIISRPAARSVPPIITGSPEGLSIPRNLSSGATTSGLFDAPAYSPISQTVGPLTIPPFANGIAPIACTIAVAAVTNTEAIPNPANGIKA